MPAPSLLDLCKRQAGRMINHIDDFGSMPYRLAKPLLIKVHTAEQLHRIEQNSPHFIGDTHELWLDLIKRDVPNWRSKPHEPSNPASWHKVYRKLVRESDREVDEDAQILQASLKTIEEERLKRTSKVVDSRTVPKLPRMHGMRVEGVKHARFVHEKPSDLRFTSGSKTKMVTGRDVLERARREARERSHFTGKNAVLARPSHRLGERATTVRHAPQGLVESHHRPENPAGSVPDGFKVIAPRKRSTAAAGPMRAADPNVPHKFTAEEREARLRAIASGKPLPASASSSSTPKPSLANLPAAQKRKRQGPSASVNDLFDDTDTLDPNPDTAADALFDDAARAAGFSGPSTTTPPQAKRRRSNSNSSPHNTGVTGGGGGSGSGHAGGSPAPADRRPRAAVAKAAVDIFMRKPRRAVR
ncbi:MAG: hypothetical protein LQ340_004394 [Diploschistes diacapsis]|nr:MAG: hypothetical protein LQ340_004394 [Diploschistes diacapsis]